MQIAELEEAQKVAGAPDGAGAAGDDESVDDPAVKPRAKHAESTLHTGNEPVVEIVDVEAVGEKRDTHGIFERSASVKRGGKEKAAEGEEQEGGTGKPAAAARPSAARTTAARKPAAAKPAVTKPVAKPTVAKPAAKKPAAKKPAARKAAAKKPAARKPAAAGAAMRLLLA